jgi:hypothetical protein
MTLFQKDQKKERKDMAIRKHKSFKQKKADKLAAKQPDAAESEVEKEVKDAPTGSEDNANAGADQSSQEAPETEAQAEDKPAE